MQRLLNMLLEESQTVISASHHPLLPPYKHLGLRENLRDVESWHHDVGTPMEMKLKLLYGETAAFCSVDQHGFFIFCHNQVSLRLMWEKGGGRFGFHWQDTNPGLLHQSCHISRPALYRWHSPPYTATKCWHVTRTVRRGVNPALMEVGVVHV